MNELALYAGAGGGLLGSVHLLGHKIVCYVERNPYCIEILKSRIADGLLDAAPIWNDVDTFDGKPWAGRVDIISAGFPCQPFSVAGVGLAELDERNKWPATVRIIREVRPRYCWLENVPGLLSKPYFEVIQSDIYQSGYAAIWDCVPAAAMGANHQRDRLWILCISHAERRRLAVRWRAWRQDRLADGAGESPATHSDATGCGLQAGGEFSEGQHDSAGDDQEISHAHGDGRGGILRQAGCGQDGPQQRPHTDGQSAGAGWQRTSCEGNVSHPDRERCENIRSSPEQSEPGRSSPAVPDADIQQLEERQCIGGDSGEEFAAAPGSDTDGGGDWWATEPDVGLVAYGVARRVERLTAIGNGQVPAVAAGAYALLFSRLEQIFAELNLEEENSDDKK